MQKITPFLWFDSQAEADRGLQPELASPPVQLTDPLRAAFSQGTPTYP